MIDPRTAPYAAMLLRITLGSLFILHLYWKFEFSDLSVGGFRCITPAIPPRS
jgi:hypothetical protein